MDLAAKLVVEEQKSKLDPVTVHSRNMVAKLAQGHPHHRRALHGREPDQVRKVLNRIFSQLSFFFRFFSPPTNFLCLTSANHLLLGINASVNFLIYCSCATRWREAPFLFFRTISSKVRPVSGSKPAWGTLSRARRKARGAISWGKSLGFEICIVVLVIVFFAIIFFLLFVFVLPRRLRARMAIIEPSALDSCGCEHVCFFLKTFFVRSFCTLLPSSWISMAFLLKLPWNVIVKCWDWGWHLVTRPHKGQTLQ